MNILSPVAGGNSAVFSSTASIIQSPKGAKSNYSNGNNKTNFQKHTGRKLISTNINNNNNSPTTATIIGESNTVSARNNNNTNKGINYQHNNNASIEELDQILELDSIALQNMKSDITKVQSEELSKLQNNLISLQKEYDSMLISNNMKQKELQSYEDKLITLQGMDDAVQTDVELLEGKIKSLNLLNSETLVELAEEQRSLKMQRHMVKRLNEEINYTKIETNKALTLCEQIKHDLELSTNSIHTNKQDLIEEELALEKLISTMKSRKEQRDGKINVLHHISVEAENSVIKLQSSLLENSITAKRAETSSRNMRRKLQTPTYKSSSFNNDNNEFDQETLDNIGSDKISALAKKINVSELRESLERYNTQLVRMEKLQKLEEELKVNIKEARVKKSDLSEQLSQAVYKIQQLASSRQIYQEVDIKDSALAVTSKLFEEAKEKDFNLKLHIEELKLCIPRFLTKVTKTHHPKPTESQLLDSIAKLEDEIVKLIKTTSAALLKDSTPDDLVLLSQQSVGLPSSEANSEFSRLQRLPGFSRLQRQLFFNLMTANPDYSKSNIRIENTPKVRRPLTTNGGMFEESTIEEFNKIENLSPGSLREAVVVSEEEVESNTYTDNTTALDRKTVKNISKLIYDRDHSKHKHILKLKEEKREKPQYRPMFFSAEKI